MANEMRLIDANAFRVQLEEIRQELLEENTMSSDFAAEVIETVQDEYLANAPTVDVEPVVHAYWELYNENSDWRCSHCKGYHFHNGGMIKKYKRCPNCGAHMDLKEADHDPG